ncbi:hypothetical protein [Thermoleptolyngbya sp. M55_K2018_002]|uniref:hypothetical protein n=1 Tax=Thermoleptolyngbya sp. M55_K2018_002 TaxID=2747808 RepID=UPI0025F23455|nr:hypothetical protein [Thermoleptolyngbya sp. M55_K2018_002]
MASKGPLVRDTLVSDTPTRRKSVAGGRVGGDWMLDWGDRAAAARGDRRAC